MGYLDATGLSRVLSGLVDKFAAKTHTHSYAPTTAVTNISRSGTTFTATRADNSTFTFTQQDSDTTYPKAVKSITRSGTTFTATCYDNSTFTFTQQDSDTTYPKAVKSITRSGTTFTATCYDNSTFTFTQQDNNTTYSAGTGITLSGTTFSNKYAKTALYNNTTGSAGSITLSATSGNYNHIRVYYRAGMESGYIPVNSVDIYSPDGKNFSLWTVHTADANGFTVRGSMKYISGKTLSTRGQGGVGWMGTGGSWSGSTPGSNNIYVVRVEGWNE